MKLSTSLLVIVAALVLAGCTYTATSQTTATPTPTKTLNQLDQQLKSTVDDGGQSDLNQIQKESTGL